MMAVDRPKKDGLIEKVGFEVFVVGINGSILSQKKPR